MKVRAVHGCFMLMLAVFPGAASSQTTGDKDLAPVRVSGRVVNPSGRPLCCVNLKLAPNDARSATRDITARARYDGVVSLSAVAPGIYMISVPGTFAYPSNVFTVRPSTVTVRGKDEVNIGDIVVEPRTKCVLQPEQIIVDPAVIGSGWTETGLLAPIRAYGSSSPVDRSEQTHKSHSPRPVPFGSYQTLEEFLGGKVKALRVVRFRGGKDSKPADMRKRIMGVWAGVFRGGASRTIPWSEGVFWSIEASIEYEDGIIGSILMDDDSIHAQVQDAHGEVWFIRLWPAG